MQGTARTISNFLGKDQKDLDYKNLASISLKRAESSTVREAVKSLT